MQEPEDSPCIVGKGPRGRPKGMQNAATPGEPKGSTVQAPPGKHAKAAGSEEPALAVASAMEPLRAEPKGSIVHPGKPSQTEPEDLTVHSALATERLRTEPEGSAVQAGGP